VQLEGVRVVRKFKDDHQYSAFSDAIR